MLVVILNVGYLTVHTVGLITFYIDLHCHKSVVSEGVISAYIIGIVKYPRYHKVIEILKDRFLRGVVCAEQ